MTEVVVKWMGKLTGKIVCENGVRSATLESRPTISGVGDMNMEERKSGDPSNQPRYNEKTPRMRHGPSRGSSTLAVIGRVKASKIVFRKPLCQSLNSLK